MLGPTGKEYIEYVVGGAARMDELLSDLRSFVQASASGEVANEEVDANVALRAALMSLRNTIQTSGAAIEYESLPTVPMHAFQMQQLFQNLISNAILYHGEQPPKVFVSAESCGSEWKFSIRDNGIGIEPQYKEQIFGMFKRLHTYDDYPGTGMGLAICQRIVERNGGRIWVESEPGCGSTFIFTVPKSKERER